MTETYREWSRKRTCKWEEDSSAGILFHPLAVLDLRVMQIRIQHDCGESEDERGIRGGKWTVGSQVVEQLLGERFHHSEES